MIKIIERFINWTIIVLVGLLPLFFLPLSLDFYDFNKNILLSCSVAILLVAWAIKMILEKKVTFRRTAFDLPILALAAAYILATIFSSPNKFEALLAPGETGTILALTLLYFIIVNNIQAHSAKRIVQSLIISGSILGLIALFQFIGLGEAFVPAGQGLDWLRLKFFTPAGSLLVLGGFLAVVLILNLFELYLTWKGKASRMATILPLYLFAGLLTTAGLLTSLYQLSTSVKPILLSLQNSWVIAIEALKVRPLFGVGPANFLTAFDAFKPISINLGDQWALKFTSSANFYLQLLTTVGLIGALAMAFLIWKIIKEIKILKELEINGSLYLAIIFVLILNLIIPVNFLLLFLLFLLLALLALNLPGKEYSETSQILPVIIAIPCFLFLVFSFWFLGRAYAAEFYFNQSLVALNQNQGTQTYNLMIKSISLNPYREAFRLNYSQVNLALANALASKKDITDQDRNNISALVQQSIREAKTAVSLNPTSANNWSNLAFIYRRLINFAEGADQWSITAYQQAINLDPFNPQLRLSLGGVYYSLQNWDEALRQFEISVQIKPDFAYGYYNLSAAYREKGDFAKAANAMETALSLVPVDSQDYQKAQEELTALKKKLGEKAEKAAETPSESLAQPEPAPTGIKPPLELPQEAQPEITPTPTSEPTPTPTSVIPSPSL